uniref:Uncharacterized protein n=1 Tax=Arundo donax TaxID=35708 RepID=A0A0A9F9B0_ARUDO
MYICQQMLAPPVSHHQASSCYSRVYSVHKLLH